MIVVSKRFIAKGEEVTNNYGVHYTQVALEFSDRTGYFAAKASGRESSFIDHRVQFDRWECCDLGRDSIARENCHDRFTSIEFRPEPVAKPVATGSLPIVCRPWGAIQ